jgi:heme/copper-type cytochrome/quinol oxidase subunit 2
MPIVTLIGLSPAGFCFWIVNRQNLKDEEKVEQWIKEGRKKMFRTIMIIAIIFFVVGFLSAWVKAMKYDKKNVEEEKTQRRYRLNHHLLDQELVV